MGHGDVLTVETDGIYRVVFMFHAGYQTPFQSLNKSIQDLFITSQIVNIFPIGRNCDLIWPLIGVWYLRVVDFNHIRFNLIDVIVNRCLKISSIC